jgi:N-methylhydantoinase B
VLNPGTPEERLLSGLETLDVPGGTIYLHVTPGAGGHGPAAQRDPDLVAWDVLNGKISVARAREVYRVSVSADGVVDEAETRRLRAGPAT